MTFGTGEVQVGQSALNIVEHLATPKTLTHWCQRFLPSSDPRQGQLPLLGKHASRRESLVEMKTMRKTQFRSQCWPLIWAVGLVGWHYVGLLLCRELLECPLFCLFGFLFFCFLFSSMSLLASYYFNKYYIIKSKQNSLCLTQFINKSKMKCPIPTYRDRLAIEVILFSSQRIAAC